MADTGTPVPPEVEIEGEATVVYRLYDRGGALLYVGVSNKLGDRLAGHAAEKHWWPQVAKKTAVLYGTRGEALMEEDRAIRTESPIHNVAGQPPARRQEKVAYLQRRVAAGKGKSAGPDTFRFAEAFLAPVDAYAEKNGIDRYAALHHLIIEGLIRDRRTDVTLEVLDEESAILEAITAECKAAAGVAS